MVSRRRKKQPPLKWTRRQKGGAAIWGKFMEQANKARDMFSSNELGKLSKLLDPMENKGIAKAATDMFMTEGKDLKEKVGTLLKIPPGNWNQFHYGDPARNFKMLVEETKQFHEAVLLRLLNKGQAALRRGKEIIQPLTASEKWKNYVEIWFKDMKTPDAVETTERIEVDVKVGVEQVQQKKPLTTIESFFSFINLWKWSPPWYESGSSGLKPVKNFVYKGVNAASDLAGFNNIVEGKYQKPTFEADIDNPLWSSLEPYLQAGVLISFESIRKTMKLDRLLSTEVAVESLVERFGMPQEARTTNFLKENRSALSKTLSAVAFFPNFEKAGPKDKQTFSTDFMASVGKHLNETEPINKPKEGTEQLPDIEIKSTANDMPKSIIFRRFKRGGEPLVPYVGQTPERTVSDLNRSFL